MTERAPAAARSAARTPAADHYERVEVASAAALRAWLRRHHARAEGVWLVTYRKQMGASYVSRDAVLDELLCFGWIDGARRQVDAQRTMQLITPRKTQAWTRTYRERAARLEAEGRMAAPGRRVIALAKAAGTWLADPEVDLLLLPTDLVTAFTGARAARTWFDRAAPSYRRNVLRWIAKARREETRRARIEQVVQSAARSERLRHM